MFFSNQLITHQPCRSEDVAGVDGFDQKPGFTCSRGGVLEFSLKYGMWGFPKLWIFSSNQTSLENRPFIDDFPMKTAIQWGFSIAMFEY